MKKHNSDNTCLICGNSRYDIGEYNAYRALKCKHCGLISVDRFPHPEEVRKLYSDTYYENYYNGIGYEKAYERFLRKGFKRKIKLIKKIAGSSSLKILEVGCGPGYFMKALKENGFKNITGYEISEGAILEASRIGIVLQKLDILRDDKINSHFDVVISWATLEHTMNPVEYFKALMSHLRPGGYLLLDTGIADTFFDTLFRGLTPWFYPPEHLYVFTRKALLHLAKEYNQKKIIKNLQFSVFQKIVRAILLFKKLLLNRSANPVQDIGILIVKNNA
jgi:2-polyprenyl-3-methyl-5-hydroxy-6-metoxy-1,4-benzoquinol methylase